MRTHLPGLQRALRQEASLLAGLDRTDFDVTHCIRRIADLHLGRPNENGVYGFIQTHLLHTEFNTLTPHYKLDPTTCQAHLLPTPPRRELFG